MVFQPIRRTACSVATTAGELLPHLFTLAGSSLGEGWPSPAAVGGYFLLHYYTLTDIFPLGSMVLFVARTFLGGLKRHDGTTSCGAKIINMLCMTNILKLPTFAVSLAVKDEQAI